MILIPAGTAQKDRAEQLDVDTDFTYLGQSCQITAVLHSTKTTKEGSDSNEYVICWDIYTYSFTKEGEVETYLSREEEVERSRVRGNDQRRACVGLEKSGTYITGDLAKCWEPTALPVPDDYRCGNAACVKVLNPGDDIAAAMAEAEGMIGGGVACLVISCCLCCVCVGGGAFVATRPEQQIAQQQPYQGGGAPVTVGAPIQATATTPHVMGQAMLVQAVPVQATVVSGPVSINVMVPPGAMPGQMLQVQAPDGRKVQACIPEGVGPGQSFTVQV